ncbi:uncharacterized protein [Coffea arabica]|uniref:Uncharacterized protein n=1 Tax=Coffea arabica TaxID=13443 RepID=A0A6P6UMB0_COFAR|nr:uncharacterized protein LOC113711822 [Coffea arabica]
MQADDEKFRRNPWLQIREASRKVVVTQNGRLRKIVESNKFEAIARKGFPEDIWNKPQKCSLHSSPSTSTMATNSTEILHDLSPTIRVYKDSRVESIVGKDIL